MSQDSNRRRPQRPRGGTPASNSRGASGAEQPARRSQATPMETPTGAQAQAGAGQRPRTGSTGRVAAPHRRAGRMMAERRRRQRIAWLLGGSSLVIIVAIIVAVVITNSNSASASCDPALLSCGTQAPNFTLPQVPNGNKVSLSSYRGHPVLLELFATWCPHCQRTAPFLEKLDAANKKKGLVILSVLADARDHNSEGAKNPGQTSVADVEWFIRQFNVKHPMLYDPNVASSLTSQAAIYKLQAFPTLYLIDKNGIIRYSHSGEIGDPNVIAGVVSQAQLQAQIDKLY